MKRLTLKLTLNDRVVFSQNASTESDHKTLDYIPGSVLLGWCASQLYNNEKLKDKSFTIFHSGNVCFSNGLPITNEGYPCFPNPNNLMQPKHQGGGIESNHLQAENISIGRPPQEENQGNIQYEAIKNKYLSPNNLKIVEPITGRQLKNAQPRDDSPEGQLYGYSHLEAGQSFVATIESDAIDEEDWQLIKNCFAGRELYLGRSKAIEYGGAVLAEVLDDYTLWPTNEIQLNKESELCIWVLSDSAIVDHQTGLSTLEPTLQDLFPEKKIDGELNKSKSVIGHRRYAPWNGRLKMRDLERSVITAGSILYYSLDASQSFNHDPVGLYQEAGLGRIWINPDVLSEGQVTKTVEKFGFTSVTPVKQKEATQDEEAGISEKSDLLNWMETRYEDLYSENQDERISEAKKELDEFYDYLKRVDKVAKFPGRTQWSQVATIVSASQNRDDLRTALFDSENAICRIVKNNNTNVETDWGVTVYLDGWNEAKPLSKWLEDKIPIVTSDKESDQNSDLSPSFKSYLTTIVAYAKSLASAAKREEAHKEGAL